MKMSEIQGLSVAELNAKLKELNSELFNLRFSHATRSLTNPMQINTVKRILQGLRPLSEKRKLRLPQTEETMENRNLRMTREGVVVSAGKMDKTVVVKVVSRVKSPIYKKVVKRTKKFKAHDEQNICGIGDTVRIMETRPLSKDKYFRVVEIIEKAK